MTKYLTRSASVLSEADRFEIQMNWMIFTAEQDARIWAPKTRHNEWFPGEFLYNFPSFTEEETLEPCECGCGEMMTTVYTHYTGNYVRPMVELFDEFYHPKCEDCCVTWVDDYSDGWDVIKRPCWNCGAWPQALGPKVPPKVAPISKSSATASFRELAQRLRAHCAEWEQDADQLFLAGDMIVASSRPIEIVSHPYRNMQEYAEADARVTEQIYQYCTPPAATDNQYPGRAPINQQRRRR